MSDSLQVIVFVGSSLYLAIFAVLQLLLWRYAARWRWLTAFHKDWRYGISGRNAFITWLGALATWVLVNGGLWLVSGTPASGQPLAIGLWVAVATIGLVAWFMAYLVVWRPRSKP
jgi:hypothetical protein